MYSPFGGGTYLTDPNAAAVISALLGGGNPAWIQIGLDWQEGTLSDADRAIMTSWLDDPTWCSTTWPAGALSVAKELDNDLEAKQAAAAAASTAGKGTDSTGARGGSGDNFNNGLLAGLQAAGQLSAGQASAVSGGSPSNPGSTVVVAGDSPDVAAYAPAEATAPAPAPLPPAPQQIVSDDASPVAANIIRITNTTDHELHYQVKTHNSALDTIAIAPHDPHDYAADGPLFVRFSSAGKQRTYTLSPGTDNALVSDDNGALDLVTQVSQQPSN